MSTTATLTTPQLVALATGYCDRCGAAGVSRFVLPSGLDLVFCGHHGREYGAALLVLGAGVEIPDATTAPSADLLTT